MVQRLVRLEIMMSKEQKDWEWENRQDAKRAIALIEDAYEILSELQGIKCAVSVSNQLCVAIHALRNESNKRIV